MASEQAVTGAMGLRMRDLVALLGGNVALAVGPWMVRHAEVGPVASAFWRLTLALPILIMLAVSLEGFRPVTRRQIGWIAFGALFFAADLGSWHSGILQTKLANATLLGNAASLIYPIYGFLVLRLWPSRWQVLALVMALAGGALLLGRSAELSAQHLRGDLLCLFAGVAYTFYLIGIERARGALPQWTVLAWSTGFSALPLLAAALALEGDIWPHSWTPLFSLALVSQIIGQGLLVLSLGRVPPLVIGLAFLIQPFVSALIGWSAYGETLAAADWAGGLLVGLALVLVRQQRAATRDQS